MYILYLLKYLHNKSIIEFLNADSQMRVCVFQ